MPRAADPSGSSWPGIGRVFTARVLDADPDDDPPWLATEYVEGPSLREAVLTNGPMPEHALLDLRAGWPRRWPRSTPPGSSTATSSPPTCCSPPRARV